MEREVEIDRETDGADLERTVGTGDSSEWNGVVEYERIRVQRAS